MINAPSSVAPSGPPGAGFGRNLPVEVGARVIVPRDLDIRFGEGASRAAFLSWTAGSTWQDTLRSALAPHGMDFRQDGRLVIIHGRGASASAGAAPVSAAASSAPLAAVSAPTQASSAPMVSQPPVEMNARTVVSTPEQMAAPAAPQGRGRNARNQPPVAPPHTPAQVYGTPEPHPSTMPQSSAPAGTPGVGAIQPHVGGEVNGRWVAPQGSTLRRTLVAWAADAGWTVVWQSDRDYPLAASATIDGSFERAVLQIFRGFADADPPVRAQMHRGNRVIVVVTQADSLNTEY